MNQFTLPSAGTRRNDEEERIIHLFRLSSGRWFEYKGWQWCNIPRDERWACRLSTWEAYKRGIR